MAQQETSLARFPTEVLKKGLANLKKERKRYAMMAEAEEYYNMKGPKTNLTNIDAVIAETKAELARRRKGEKRGHRYD